MFEKKKTQIDCDILKEIYRYLSEYQMIIEFHDEYETPEIHKISNIKKIKDYINNIL